MSLLLIYTSLLQYVCGGREEKGMVEAVQLFVQYYSDWVFIFLSFKQSPAKCKMTKQQSYSYQALSEVKVNSVVDVYGIVKFVKPAVKGKGSGKLLSSRMFDFITA